ncbi:hypothetical protein CWO91_25160 [Bradyrhizobium genosp. SA-3]|uniref:hypothetical protein n=1 Tax=Bradyrhizobium genosp. SA-3 TaxID=508868 RepID=UPI00102A08A5|nr:hypothetical protein [Bradyrhizobium genosp. SA-3]RZN07869.1 hypothetical protein CWO91_25160 [Bradyrhizobium genosp. SA-3]
MIREAGFGRIKMSCINPARVVLIACALSGTGLAVGGACFPRTIDDLKAGIDLGGGQLGALHMDLEPDLRLRRIEDCVSLLEGWIRVASDHGMSIEALPCAEAQSLAQGAVA